jgi:hypothetical protein
MTNEIIEPTGEELGQATAEVLAELITVPVKRGDDIPAVPRSLFAALGLKCASNPNPVLCEIRKLRGASAEEFIRANYLDRLREIADEINATGAPVTTYDLEVPHCVMRGGRSGTGDVAARCVIAFDPNLDRFIIRFDVLYAANQSLRAAA